MELKVLICSVHFGPGHTAHLEAYQKLATECGYESALYLAQPYMKLFNHIEGQVFFQLEDALAFQPDVLWLYNIGMEDISVIKAFKKIHTKVAYVLHEPYMGFKELCKEKHTFGRMTAAAIVNYLLCQQADRVVLSSKYAVANCQKYMKRAYRKSTVFPLIFPDAMLPNQERKYFSMIGGYSDPHNSPRFLEFVKESYQRNTIRFQIATRNNIEDKLQDAVLQTMMQEGRLIVQQGRPLTEQEMNTAYRSSICTWSAYVRCTQSGVLANSFMQGTPVVAAHIGSFEEYVQDGENGVFVKDYSYEAIFNAYKQIENNLDDMSKNCRKTFLNQFYYRNQIDNFKKIVENL